eukprot:4027377-Prymnesium_polylepis.2
MRGAGMQLDPHLCLQLALKMVETAPAAQTLDVLSMVEGVVVAGSALSRQVENLSAQLAGHCERSEIAL